MGAGENYLLNLFSILEICPNGTLILIDEIELGLHEEAQIRLIDELKEICLSKKIQIICTTHSGVVLSSLPPKGRIFIERINEKICVINEISSEYAISKLSREEIRRVSSAS